jgi:hypothetical protein
MDGGSNLNILYAHTLRLLGIGLDQLRPSTTPFHGVALGKRDQPLWQIDLPVWFGTPDNYRKETLTFEVVGFRGAYHAILGRPCYAKFMAVPNYTYLKMKMSEPNGVITMGSSIEHAFDCNVECVEHAGALALDEALVANMEKMVNKDLDSAAKHAGSFEAAEQTKEVLSYGPPWAHYLGGYQDRLLGGPLGLPGLRYTASVGVEHKDNTGVVLG